MGSSSKSSSRYYGDSRASRLDTMGQTLTDKLDTIRKTLKWWKVSEQKIEEKKSLEQKSEEKKSEDSSASKALSNGMIFKLFGEKLLRLRRKFLTVLLTPHRIAHSSQNCSLLMEFEV